MGLKCFPNLPTSGNIPLCSRAGMIFRPNVAGQTRLKFFKGGENEVLAMAKLQSDVARDSD